MIWGDDGETGDHIVPFKVRSEQLKRKEHIDESNKAVKPAEQTLTGTKVEFHDIKLGSSSRHNATDEGIPQTGFCMSSWPDLSLPHARYSSKTGGAFLETVLFCLGTFFQNLIMFKLIC